MTYPAATEYFTGRQLWRLAMPSTVRPRATGYEGGDPGLQPGTISTVTRAGVGASGTVAIYSGGPTDTFAVRLEIVAGGALGAATFRTRLQAAEAWSSTQTTPMSGLHELPESGLFLSLTGPFAAGETHDFTTTEAAQQRELRRGVALEVDRLLRTRGALPLTEWGVDVELLCARCVAWELLGLRGYDPKSGHDALIMERARRSWEQLREIREELQQGGWAGQSSTAGVAMASEPAQGQGLW